jgi:hypothetical protein
VDSLLETNAEIQESTSSGMHNKHEVSDEALNNFDMSAARSVWAPQLRLSLAAGV